MASENGLMPHYLESHLYISGVSVHVADGDALIHVGRDVAQLLRLLEVATVTVVLDGIGVARRIAVVGCFCMRVCVCARKEELMSVIEHAK